MIQDQAARSRALDVSESFIVQAPAGSGKTELLTQRFLALLAHAAQKPEQILAITFTRKAAAEMRARIMANLERATDATPPANPYELTTWNLARKALARDTAEAWDILQHPNRLQIKTVDALCAEIASALPVTSKFGAIPNVMENPETLYKQAAHNLLQELTTDNQWSNALERVVAHVDNQLNKAEDLIVQMLRTRDQWLIYTGVGDYAAEIRERLEANLSLIIEDVLATAAAQLPADLQQEWLSLANVAASNLQAEHIYNWPLPAADELHTWRRLTALVLTKENELRKMVNKTNGFPAPSSFKNKDEKATATEHKQRIDALLIRLAEDPQILAALQNIPSLPEPNYSEAQWYILSALLELLPYACAQLDVVFRATELVDFTQISQAARLALNTEQAPTDIALALDYRLQHLLVDEFQDTSLAQWQLLEQLTSEWLPGDGRSLFLVGDPQQSIYRFRQAEVALFTRAEQDGIQAVQLTPLKLTMNFRSQAKLVDWVNTNLAQVFPKQADRRNGAIVYSQAVPAKPGLETAVNSCVHTDETAEAAWICAEIKAIRQIKPDASIAILSRARSHVHTILQQLRAENIPSAAVDIERLIDKAVIWDLSALTRALLDLTDRIAWLAILRAPWCGLQLADLTIIADRPNCLIWETLQNTAELPGLSDFGLKRLHTIAAILQLCMQQRRRLPLRYWVEQTWLALGGNYCYSDPATLTTADLFFKQLAIYESGGRLQSVADLEQALADLYASPAAAQNPVQVMTIHKSKGLEFEYVFLPGLQRGPAADKFKLLEWLDYALPGSECVILAPIKARDDKSDVLGSFVRKHNSTKSDFEAARVLYVALTRAKQQLFLSAIVDKPDYSLKNGSFLKLLWNEFAPHCNNIAELDVAPEVQIPERKFWRLPVEQMPAIPAVSSSARNPTDPQHYAWHTNEQRILGIVLHQTLYEMATQGVQQWQARSFAQHTEIWQARLAEQGFTNSEELITVLIDATDKVLHCAKAKWILSQHPVAAAEWPIHYRQDGQLKKAVIDRTFICDGVRWIVDYKTTPYAGTDLDEFLRTQSAVHAAQLQQYAHLLREMGESNVKTALYFPLLSAWVEV